MLAGQGFGTPRKRGLKRCVGQLPVLQEWPIPSGGEALERARQGRCCCRNLAKNRIGRVAHFWSYKTRDGGGRSGREVPTTTLDTARQGKGFRCLAQCSLVRLPTEPRWDGGPEHCYPVVQPASGLRDFGRQ